MNTLNIVEQDWFVGDYVRNLEHELALARASSDYWRAKYITHKAASEEYAALNKYYVGSWEDAKNALYWFERAARSPMDECDE